MKTPTALRYAVSVLLLLVPRAGAASPQAPGAIRERIDAAAGRLESEMVAYRHRFHEHPELGNREFETATAVAAHLASLGLEVRTGVAHTGVVGILRGERPGPVVAVRADMDALPVTEETDFPFRSTVRTTYAGMEVGVMHACGHDIHTAGLMGVASVLSGMRADLPGTVIFLFQPAEEGPPPGEEGGASLMLEEGVFADPRPEAVFGLHTRASIPLGEVGYASGPELAAVDQFRITIKGRQSHGAAPHEGIDPVVMASEAVLAFQTIPSRTINPTQPVVLTVGMIHGGERFNIIPGEVRLEGTVRTYDPGVRDRVERRMMEVLDGITKANGGSFEMDYSRGTPPTVNDPTLTRRVVPSLQAVLGMENVNEIEPWMAGEDFAYFANEVPGFFFFLGTLKEGTTSGPHHSPTFRADDGAVVLGIRTLSTVIADYLFRGNTPK